MVICLGLIILIGELIGVVVIVIFCEVWIWGLVVKFNWLIYSCIDCRKFLFRIFCIGLVNVLFGVLLKFII